MPTTVAAPLTITEYSEKAVIVKGDTKTHRHLLKAIGGRWHFKAEGWIFPKKWEPDLRLKLNGLIGGDTLPSLTPTPSPRTPTPKTDPRIARFRDLAEKMQKDIDYKFNPAIAGQRLTRRRAGIADSMRADGIYLEKVQRALRAVADALERGALGPQLSKDLRSKKDVQDALSNPDVQALLERVTPTRTPQDEKRDELRAKERELIGRDIPGFFPTPGPVIERMLEKADDLMVEPPTSILEPSAGKGDILTAAFEHYPDAELTAVEINSTLVGLLHLKRDCGLLNPATEIHHDDFLTVPGLDEYHLALLNPPFEKGLDIVHVRRAFDFVTPGGVLVAIMSEGPFFRNDAKATEFRDWLDFLGGESEKLDPDAFNTKDAFRTTGVQCRLVWIVKE